MKVNLVEVARKWGNGEIKGTDELRKAMVGIEIYTPDLSDRSVELEDVVWTLNDGNSWVDVDLELVQEGIITRTQRKQLFKAIRNLDRY